MRYQGEFPCLCSTCELIGSCDCSSSTVKHCRYYEKVEEDDEEELDEENEE